MHPVNPNSGLIQAANQLQEPASSARQGKMNLAFQVVTAINGIALSGMVATHLWRDIRRAEREREGRRGR
jgi:hypothetical protein